MLYNGHRTGGLGCGFACLILWGYLGMRTMKRVGALVLVLAVLLASSGCKHKRKAHAGASSVEELATNVLKVINGEEEYSKIADWMDWYGAIGVRMVADIGIECDFLTARDVVEDLDEGAGYIKKHHKDFAKAWKEKKGKEITQNSLSAYANLKKKIDDAVATNPDEIYEEFKQFAPYDTTFDPERVFERPEYNIGHYSVRTGDETLHHLEINYYIDEGNYVCYGMNWVA